MQSRVYEITLKGEADPTTCAAFDDYEVIVGSGTTTIRAELPDQGALWGLVLRIIGLGLEVTDLHLIPRLTFNDARGAR